MISIPVTLFICVLLIIASPQIILMVLLAIGGLIISPFYAIGDWCRYTRWSPHWRLILVVLSFVFRDIILQLGSLLILIVLGGILMVCVVIPYKLYKRVRYGLPLFSFQ